MVQTVCSKSIITEKRKIFLNKQTISYIIKRSARVKHVRLEVRPETGLTVVIPQSYKIGQLPNLLETKGRWILDKLAKHGEVQPPYTNKAIKNGDFVSYHGLDLEVVIRQNHQNTNNVKLEQHRLVVSLRSTTSRLNMVLEQWYRMQAAKLIKARADKLSARLGLTYHRVTIRGQKTRWGSCSHKGNLSFNWKLIMAPQPVIDYIIIHELAHLKEMNHSKRFWELVAEHSPRWREHKQWLKDHETELAAKLSC
jgi:predicted metal-dependent hydrolase